MRKNFRSKFLFIILVLCCFMVTSVWAAKKVELYKSNSTAYIDQLNQNNNFEGTSLAAVFGLGADEKLTELRLTTDFNRVIHSRYQQTYKDIPVWGMQTVISTDSRGNVIRLHGTLARDIPGDIGNIPGKLDPLGALRNMEENHKKKDKTALWNFENEEYGTYIYIDKKGKAKLCYVVSFYADNENGNPSRPVYFVNVKNGKVIDSFDNLQYAVGTGPGGNQKVGQYYYGTTYPGFGVTVNGSTCTMNTTDVKTVNLNHGTSGSTAYSYTCYENTYKSINGAYCPLNDAQYFGQVVYDMYQDWYGLAVLPFQLMMRVHYSTNYENAFWNGSSMTFGDGYTTFYPLVGLDVSAHEVSHGFTQYNSNLTYSGQSGGINEAFSDMAGEAAEYYMRGTNDFKVGYDIFKSPTGALRYMYDPPLDGRSIDHISQYYSGLDVHYSSGLYNKVFYLVATASGWDTRMAFDIFTKANTDYWISSTNFQQGAEGVVDAALDYAYDCGDVAAAFAVVGITVTCPGPPAADFSGTPTTGENPLTVNFTDLSTNSPTSWSWNFGDTGTSTSQNPSHTYTAVGTYTVTLVAANASGSDTEIKVGYITVTAPQPPVISNIQAVDITSGSARITWTTDEPATSVVYYGTTTAYGLTASAAGYTTAHSVTLTGLAAETLYHFKVESADASGNTSQSGDNTFTTSAASQDPEIYVYSITMQKFQFLWLYRAEGTITVRDTDNNVVPNATVYIQWSGKATGTASGATNANGQVTFNSGWKWGNGTFTITVTNVTHATLQYNSALNNETSDSI